MVLLLYVSTGTQTTNNRVPLGWGFEQLDWHFVSANNIKIHLLVTMKSKKSSEVVVNTMIINHKYSTHSVFCAIIVAHKA